jgi:hypothetical protein
MISRILPKCVKCVLAIDRRLDAIWLAFSGLEAGELVDAPELVHPSYPELFIY